MYRLPANEMDLETEPEAGAGLDGSAQECAEAPGLALGSSTMSCCWKGTVLRGCGGGGHSRQRMHES